MGRPRFCEQYRMMYLPRDISSLAMMSNDEDMRVVRGEGKGVFATS